MSLIVEDGSGKTDAESYISAADADARHTAFGNAAWTGATADKEAALRRATAFMVQRYRNQWIGYRTKFDQALDWPRIGVTIDEYHFIGPDTLPADIAGACADLALRALSGDLSADLTQGIVSETVGPISTEYDRYSPQATRFPAIEQALAPYLKASGSRLARA